ncbi:MAG: translation initiation factor [Bdellovibrionota bacterium]
MSSEQGLSRFVASRGFTATVKVDSAGRKGKTVTVIGGLPKNKLFLEAMAKALKARCGSGGSVDTSGRDGVIEIQGDQREKIRAYLDSESIKHKIS